jgi:hypothetical protein
MTMACFSVQAQTQIKGDSVKGDSSTFDIIQPDPASRYGKLTVYNHINQKSGTLTGKEFKPTREEIDAKMVDPDGINKSFQAVFTKARIQALLPEKSLSIIFYLTKDKKVSEIAFRLDPKTLITVQELELLEKQLKANCSFTFIDYSDTTSLDYAPLNSKVVFKNIIDYVK